MSVDNQGNTIKMQIKMMQINDLVPYENNPRKNDHAVAQVGQAIREFGFRVPILAKSNGEIIDGHLRLKAAKHIGLTEVPVMMADDMSEAQIMAFRISVNKVAELAKWDMTLLKNELLAIKSMEYDVMLTGFQEVELDDLLGLAGNDEDNVPALKDTCISQPGDMWILDNHRLLCGDSTDQAAYKLLMSGASAAMIFTDPPYNVDYEGKAGKIKNDKMTAHEFDDFLRAVFSCLSENLSAGGGGICRTRRCRFNRYLV